MMWSRAFSLTVTSAAIGIVLEAIACGTGNSSDDATSPPAETTTVAPTLSQASTTTTPTPTPKTQETEAFPGVPLPEGARLASSTSDDNAEIPVPFETEDNVALYTKLAKKSYEVSQSEAELTAFYSAPPTGWSVANQEKPTIWVTERGHRAVWIFIIPPVLFFTAGSTQ